MMDNEISIYEKLGLFYLGKEVNPETFQTTENLFVYKSKDFTTRATIIGMTGSGKTGLGVAIIEEATIDKIPSIILDPKGEMGNLLLAFPELSKDDFKEWIDPAEAENKGMDPALFAEETAREWEEGIKSFYQDRARIKLYRESADFAIYTPGSSVGILLSVLSSFDVPSLDVLDDPETYSSMINSTVMGLLSLINIKADPLTSKEYILLSAIFAYFWKKGVNLSLEELIGHIINPPFEKIGVLSLNNFYPQKERFELAMLLNNILTSPGFSMWLEGERLDIQNLLYTKEGKPRVSIISLAHLDNTQRIFFVTLFLNKYISWMRQQRGTSSLRTLLYMDEIFGFFPATSNPPSKMPMLVLLKQARAYGIGIVLATQNPVDLDYKGLSNIGSWFLGRLQTKQDQEKVIDGLIKNTEEALDRNKIEKLLMNMRKRTFLLKSAYLDSTPILETRWVLSYLRGPLTTSEIKKLMQQKKGTITEQSKEEVEIPVSFPQGKETIQTKELIPLISEKIRQYFLNNPPFVEGVLYRPWLIMKGRVRFYSETKKLDQIKEVSLKIPLNREIMDINFKDALSNEDDLDLYDQKPLEQARFVPLPPFLEKMKDLRMIEKKFKNYLYDNTRLEFYTCPKLKVLSKPEEDLASFKSRLGDLIREEKDREIEKMTEKYAQREEKLKKEYEKLNEKLAKEEMDVKAASTQSVLSVGSSILGALLGRTRIGTLDTGVTGLRRATRIVKEKKDVELVKSKIEELNKDLQVLEEELKKKIDDINSQFDIENYPIETLKVKPNKSDISEISVALLWDSG